MEYYKNYKTYNNPMKLVFSILNIFFRLFYNGLSFRIRRVLQHPGPVRALSIEITHRCICHCIMCNIWKIPKNTPELSLQQWMQLLEDPFFADLVELDITGGEPFLVDGLEDFFQRLTTLKEHQLPKLCSVAITTNGILTDKVLETTRKILERLEGSGIQLVLACAMDAINDRHDSIRGLPGAFVKMQSTLQGLAELRRVNPSLILGIKTTIVPGNVDQLDAINVFASQRGLFTIISPCIVTEGRFLNRDLAQNLHFDLHHIEMMQNFFKKQSQSWFASRNSVRKVLHGQGYSRLCSCGFNYAFIRSSGEMLLCPLLADSVGSVQRDGLEPAWLSVAAKNLRGSIGRSATCHYCTEPGLERYSLVNEGWGLISVLLKEGPLRFKQLYTQLGLHNYFRKWL